MRNFFKVHSKWSYYSYLTKYDPLFIRKYQLGDNYFLGQRYSSNKENWILDPFGGTLSINSLEITSAWKKNITSNIKLIWSLQTEQTDSHGSFSFTQLFTFHSISEKLTESPKLLNGIIWSTPPQTMTILQDTRDSMSSISHRNIKQLE